MQELIVYNGRLHRREGLHFIRVKNGVITEIDRMESIEGNKWSKSNDKQCIDAEGGLILPPFIDSHIHYDSAFTAGEPRWNRSGTLLEAIDCLNERKLTADKLDYEARAFKLIKWQVAQGIQFARVHTDVSGPDLTSLEVMLELKEKVSPWIHIQIVAFPQLGITSQRQLYEYLEEALKMGADGVGGIPHIEMTRELGIAAVKQAFDLAEKYDKFVDVHCDETDDDQSKFIEVMAAEAFFREMGSRTTASHVTAMHSYNNAYAAKLITLLQRSGLNIVSNPLSNIALQGRYDSFPVRRGLTRIKSLLEAGVNVSLGHDNFIDPFYSLGTAGMLPVLNMALHACHLLSYEEINQGIDLITHQAAMTLQLGEDQYGLKVGCPANMIIMDAPDVYETIRSLAPVRYCIRFGKVIAENAPRKSKVYDPVTQQSEELDLSTR